VSALLGESSLSAALGLVALALLPLALMTLTSFAKIAVVFSALRNAIGATDVPSGAIVSALALALSVYAMGPLADAIAERSRALPAAERDTLGGVLEAAREPARDFLRRNAGPAETAMLLQLAADRGQPRADDELSVLWASFALAELREAFQLGFFVYLPFLVLDLVIGNALLALGVAGLSPTMAALPFKLLLFVAADGFLLVTRALLMSYG
jgi:type III secretion protein R